MPCLKCGDVRRALRRLCFACAHGRPTLAPLVHLPTLRGLMQRAHAQSDFSMRGAGAHTNSSQLPSAKCSLEVLVAQLQDLL